jgi:uncharacterized protein (DUF2147 family)
VRVLVAKIVATTILIGVLPQAAADGSLAGRWATFDGKTKQRRSVIEIVLNGSEARGRIVELYVQPGEEPDPVCQDCPGNARNRKIRGLQILTLRAEPSSGTWQGKVLDPEEGRVYMCVARLSTDNKHLELRGYVGFEIFGRTEVWARDD